MIWSSATISLTTVNNQQGMDASLYIKKSTSPDVMNNLVQFNLTLVLNQRAVAKTNKVSHQDRGSK